MVNAKTTFNDLLDYLHQEKFGFIHHTVSYMNYLKVQQCRFCLFSQSFLGNHAVGAKVDGEIKPLSTPLLVGRC
jgi:guanosine-3',5'-bis(diphosphate) 3'-pyrophosphohydrolase